LSYSTFNVAFAVWLLIGFIEEVPAEIEEAGLVDGCSRWSVLFRVTLPIVAPGLVVTALFCFIFAWNEFLFALILTRQAAITVPVQLAAFQAPTKILWGEMSAFATVGILPPLIFAFLLQRYLVRGLAAGGVK
jgi:multiple sugar transport system permease protein